MSKQLLRSMIVDAIRAEARENNSLTGEEPDYDDGHIHMAWGIVDADGIPDQIQGVAGSPERFADLAVAQVSAWFEAEMGLVSTPREHVVPKPRPTT